MQAHSSNVVATSTDLQSDRARLWGSLMQLARIGATDKGDICRLALTALDSDARNQFIAWRKEIGCMVRALDLHGAMVAENSADGEGDLLARLRKLLPHAPIAVALDLHGNVTQKMIDNADVIVSFKTYPHVDVYETGAHAARLLFDMIEGRAKPVIAWRQPPLLTHTLRSASADGAMKRALDAARVAEAHGMLAVSVLAGFAFADIAAPCISVVVVGNRERAGAEAVAARIARQIWDERDDFVYRSTPLAESVARAASLARGADRPVLLLDHGDNCMSGGTCDTMDLLEEALKQGLEGIVSGPLCDPQAVAALVASGVGSTVTLAIGNKLTNDALPARAPLAMTGVVRALTDGEYVISGLTYISRRAYMGRAAVLDTGTVKLVVTERTHEPGNLDVSESVGIDPRRALCAAEIAYVLPAGLLADRGGARRMR